MAELRKALQPVVVSRRRGGPVDSPAARLSQAIAGAASRGPAIIPALEKDLLAGLEQRLDMLRGVIDAQPVTIDSLPPQLRNSWITPDGRARVEVFPRRTRATTRRCSDSSRRCARWRRT